MFWREQADLDVYDAVSERMVDRRWSVPRVDVIPDGRSRFFSPYDPDYQPLPPDDPAASVYLTEVDGWEGYKGWHDFGSSFTVENPQWMAQFGLPPTLTDPVTGQYVEAPEPLNELTLNELVELSLIHSREYQFEIEDLYLAALGLTLDRYQFAVRYLGTTGREPGISETFTILPRRPGDNLTQNSNFGIRQALPTGAQWAVELANNTIWLFSGPGQTNSASVLSFSLVQPLIMGAGRKVVLEGLTQSEREVLYATRDLARFRQVFFCDVVGSGGGGYLGLLEQLQGIRNQQDNIYRTERELLEQREVYALRPIRFRQELEALPPDLAPVVPDADAVFPDVFNGQLTFDNGYLTWMGDMSIEQEQALLDLSADLAFDQAATNLVQDIRRIPPGDLDIFQLESRLASAINALRSSEVNLQDNLDSYKIQLGLPPDLPISIDDELLDPFVFIDPQLRDLELQTQQFVTVWAQLDEENPTPESLLEVALGLQQLIALTETQGLALIEADLAARLVSIEDAQERVRVEEALSSEMNSIEADYRSVQELTQVIVNMLRGGQVPIEELAGVRGDLNSLREALLEVVRSLQVAQIGLRVEMITVPAFNLSIEEVTQIALENRVDLMNAQARVTDAYRQVEIAANALQTPVDVVVEGDIGTSGGNRPFDFRADETTIRAGIQLTAPIDQVAERNIYRAAQIAYDRQRREYMAFEDNVKLQVRRQWRQLDVLRQNVETSRLGVLVAAKQLESAIADSRDPAQFAAQGNVQDSGVQGLNLLNALDSVLEAQNRLIGDWLDYERARLNIYRDMGIMEVGPDGLWNDPVYRSESYGSATVEFRGQSPPQAGIGLVRDPGGRGDDPVGQSVLAAEPPGPVGRAGLFPSGNGNR